MTKEIPIDDRDIGSETEFGDRFQKENPGIIATLTPSIPHVGQYLINGGRLYPDHHLVEYATPECTLATIVKHEIKGESIAWQTAREIPGLLSLHKRSITPNGMDSIGPHENYATTIDIWTPSQESDDNINTLASFFATRPIFLGAGYITPEGNYVMGQKMHHIEEVVGSNSTRDKALVNDRKKPYSGGSPIKRLHVVCGDANISPWAIKMKYGTTSLVLRLLEHGKNYGIDTSDLFLANPLAQAHEVAGDITVIDKKLDLKNGGKKTALEIQKAFAQKVEKLASYVQLPKDELEILEQWKLILSALDDFTTNNNEQKILKKIDWFTKQQFIEEKRQEKGGLTIFQEHALDLFYDRIPKGYNVFLRQTLYATDMPPQEELDEAGMTPPPGRRAQLRGAVILPIRNHLKRHPEDTLNTTISWEHFTHPRTRKIYRLPLLARNTDDEVQEQIVAWFPEAA